MLASQILFMTGVVFISVHSAPFINVCIDVQGNDFECPPPPPPPENTIAFTCNPPIVDASNVQLPYTFKNLTPAKIKLNRRIEKAMGRGECTYRITQLQEIYDTFGSYLTSVYPPPNYVGNEKSELATKKACYVTCIDAKDQPTIDWCNSNGCPIVVS